MRGALAVALMAAAMTGGDGFKTMMLTARYTLLAVAVVAQLVLGARTSRR